MQYLTDSMKDILNTESIETVASLLNKGCNYAHTGLDSKLRFRQIDVLQLIC